MSKETTKKFIENNGFICNKCAKVVVDGTKHKNEEDLCDQCKISDLEAKLAEKDNTIKGLIEQYKTMEKSCSYEMFLDCQKQLAEKEKELHYKTAECEKWKAYYENCSELEKIMSKEHQYCLDNWRASEKRLAELEEQLKNAIVPKFKIGQEVWYVWNKSQVIPFKCKIENIVYDSSKNYKLKYDSEHYICMQEQHLFATKEEAETKLKELQGE